MRSFIGWIGGKSQLKKYIIPLIPKTCSRYIEVCGGAGWVLFGKEMIKGQMEIFNDIDSDLINLYRQIKTNCFDLQKEIDWLQSRELFEDFREAFRSDIPMSELQRAARYLYLIRCSFGSNRYSFATSPSRPYNLIDLLPLYRDRLKDVIIENRDFEKLISTYDRQDAVFYIDPPYVGSEKYYNKKYSCFTMSDHERLNRCLSSIKGKFILSYNDCKIVRELYQDYNVMGIDRKNTLPSNPEDCVKYKELIITNY